jgi:hypothetical protein
MDFYIVQGQDEHFRLGYIPATNWSDPRGRHVITMLAKRVTLFNGETLVNDFATLEEASDAWRSIEGQPPRAQDSQADT